MKFRGVLCPIRLFPTLISKIKWLGSELPLNQRFWVYQGNMGHSQILGVYSHHHQHQFFIQTIRIVLMILWILVILVFQIHKLEVLTRRNIRTGIPALTPKKIFLTWWIEINFKIQGLYLILCTTRAKPDNAQELRFRFGWEGNFSRGFMRLNFKRNP